ncbi:MAG: hypothetical protein ACTHKG_04995 [Nocardioides sp.]
METTPRTATVEIALEESVQDVWRPASADQPAGAPAVGRFRFVARLSGDSVTLFVGSPFTMPRASVAGLADDVEVDLDARVRLGELDSALTTAGWRYLAQRGPNWWSLRYSKG